jgi:plastocyanin
VTVAIVGSAGSVAFSPNPVSASAGDAVAFKNNDTTSHHIVLDDGSADLGLVNPNGTSASFTVRSSASARFHCTLHPSMVGTINGASAPQPPDDPSPY